jgi:hypothetical protein
LGIPVTIIPPSEVKKYATTKGNADKNLMYSAWIADTGIDLKGLLTPKKQDSGSPVSDIVDSFYICKRLYSTIANDNKITTED